MRLWVDDERRLEEWKEKPGFEYLKDGDWQQAYTYRDAVLKINYAIKRHIPITAISLDNDLGDRLGKEGYDVLKIIEALLFQGIMPLPEIHIHTANTSAGDKMRLVVARLREKYGTY